MPKEQEFASCNPATGQLILNGKSVEIIVGDVGLMDIRTAFESRLKAEREALTIKLTEEMASIHYQDIRDAEKDAAVKALEMILELDDLKPTLGEMFGVCHDDPALAEAYQRVGKVADGIRERLKIEIRALADRVRKNGLKEIQ